MIAQIVDRRTTTAEPIQPGLIAVASGVGVAWLAQAVIPGVSFLVAAVFVGALAANTVGIDPRLQPGVRFAARRLLRVGIVLLGFRLSFGDIASIGGPGLAVVAGTVVATFFGTQWLGKKMGLDRDLSLLVATGYSICGASAIAAMNGTVDADEEDVAMSIALVTLFGSLAIVVLPIVSPWLGFADGQFGTWVGASTHDVAQVVAAASAGGSVAASAAIVVKLTRIVLLAPLVAGVSMARRSENSGTTRPPVVPLFVAGFLAAVALRTTGVLGGDALSTISTLEKVLLAAAMVGLGAGVDIKRLRRLGARPIVLGTVAWIVVAGVSAIGVALIA